MPSAVPRMNRIVASFVVTGASVVCAFVFSSEEFSEIVIGMLESEVDGAEPCGPVVPVSLLIDYPVFLPDKMPLETPVHPWPDARIQFAQLCRVHSSSSVWMDSSSLSSLFSGGPSSWISQSQVAYERIVNGTIQGMKSGQSPMTATMRAVMMPPAIVQAKAAISSLLRLEG